MTPAARVDAVVQYGFTDRQARFLVTVMLHSGVCLGRQYCTFAGIVRGEKMHEFFRYVVKRGYGRVYPRAHGQTRLYHVHSKTLYRAIGDPESRHRKPMPVGRAIERLMVLDAVLTDRSLRWLATEREKLAHFTRLTSLDRRDLPHLTFGEKPSQTIRYFADKLPIGIDPKTDAHVFLYLVTKPVPVDFRPFLHRHAELLRALPRWTIRLLVPPHLAGAIPLYQAAANEELGTPLRPAAVDELRWYFHRRREAESGGRPLVADARYRRAQQAFAAPRFRVLYRTWLHQGDPALHATTSPTLADALARQAGHVEPEVLAQSYQRLSSLVGTA